MATVWFVKNSEDKSNNIIYNFFAPQDDSTSIRILAIDKDSGEAWIEYPCGTFEKVTDFIEPSVIENKHSFACLVSADIVALVLANPDLKETLFEIEENSQDNIKLLSDFDATNKITEKFKSIIEWIPQASDCPCNQPTCNKDTNSNCNWKFFKDKCKDISKLPNYSGTAFEEWIFKHQAIIADAIKGDFPKCVANGTIPPNLERCGDDFFQLDTPTAPFTRCKPPIHADQGTCDLCDAKQGEAPSHFIEAKVCRGNTVSISYNNHRLLSEVSKCENKFAWLIVARSWDANSNPTSVQIIGPKTMKCILTSTSCTCGLFKLKSREGETLFKFPQNAEWSMKSVDSHYLTLPSMHEASCPAPTCKHKNGFIKNLTTKFQIWQ